MVRTSDLDPPGGYVVATPRASDALGRSLRQAFDPGTEADTPAALASLLRRLRSVN